MTAGIDRRTGRPLSGWAHVMQSIDVIFTTRIAERIMRRTFGSAVPSLLGRNLTPETIHRFVVAIVVAIELWEPRFRVRRIGLSGKTTSVSGGRQGRIGLRLEGDYRPNALEGDFTVAEPKQFNV